MIHILWTFQLRNRTFWWGKEVLCGLIKRVLFWAITSQIAWERHWKHTRTWSFNCVLLFGCSLCVNFTTYMTKSEKQMMFLMQVNGKLNFNLKWEITHRILFCFNYQAELSVLVFHHTFPMTYFSKWQTKWSMRYHLNVFQIIFWSVFSFTIFS